MNNKKIYLSLITFASLLFIGNFSTVIFVAGEITYNEIHYGYNNQEIITWGGTGDEGFVYTTFDTNGHLIMTCFSESFGASSDIYVAKFDKDTLNQDWNSSWTHADDATPAGIFVHNTTGNIFVAGTIVNEVATSKYIHNVFVLKFNSTGSLKTSYIHETDNLDETAVSVVFDNDDNFFVTGSTNSTSGPLFIQKYTLSGSYVTTYYYGNTAPLEAMEVGGMTIDDNGDIFIAATTDNTPTGNFQDLVLIKINSTTGSAYWNTTFGETQPDDRGIDVIVSKGFAYLAGHFIDDENIAQELNMIILQVNATTGSINWNKAIHQGNDTTSAIAVNRHGNVVITGQNNKRDAANYDLFVAELNQSDGGLIWNDTITFSNGAIANDLKIKDDYAFISGTSYIQADASNDAVIIRYTDNSEFNFPEPGKFGKIFGIIIGILVVLFSAFMITALLITYWKK